jgi:hypothetical protein
VEATQSEIESNAVSEELYHVLDELKVVMNNLPRHDYLREADVDKRINTDLLRQVYRIEDDFGERLIIL